MVSKINLAAEPNKVSVAPGASVELEVSVQNLTTLLDQVAVRLEGIDASWVQVIPPQLPVFASSQATARLVLQPPADLGRARAGAYPLRLTGTSQENPDQVGDATAELEIQLSGDYQVQLEPGEAQEEGTWVITARNSANAPLQLSFAASDEGSALWYKFEPFQLTVAPGAQETTRLGVRAKQARANARPVEFTMVIDGEYLLLGGTRVQAPAHTLSGTYRPPAPGAIQLTIQPAVNQGEANQGFEVGITNPGRAPVNVRLVGQASENDLNFEFAPPMLTVSPRTQARARLLVSPLGAPANGKRETFRVLALPEDNSVEPVSAEAIYLIEPPPPKELPTPARVPVSYPAPRPAPFPWLALVSGTLSFVFTFLMVAAVAVILGWRP